MTTKDMGPIEAGVPAPRSKRSYAEVQTPVLCATCPAKALSPTGVLSWSLELDVCSGKLKKAQCPACVKARK